MQSSLNSPKIDITLYDVFFFLLMFSTFYFTRNLFCRLLMLLFAGLMLAVTFFKKKRILGMPFYIGFAAFIGYGAANIIFYNVINNIVSKTMVFSLCLNLIMIFCIVQYIVKTNNNDKVLFLFENAIFCAALLVVILSRGSLATDRLGGGTEMNSNELALLSVYGFIICFYRFEKIANYRFFTVLKMLFFLAIIFLTGSRKGVIMVLAAIFLIAILGKKKRFLLNLFIFAGIAVLLYLLLTKVELFYNMVGYRFEYLFDFLNTGSTEDYSIESRSQLVEIGWYYIQYKPWTGFGYDCFKLVSGLKSNISEFYLYSHNNYVELLFSGGIFALVLYYLPILWLIIKVSKNLKQEKVLKYCFVILVVKHLIEYAYVSYYSRIDAYVLAIVLGVYLVVMENSNISLEGGAIKNAINNKIA